jgi:hypothetical protein
MIQRARARPRRRRVTIAARRGGPEREGEVTAQPEKKRRRAVRKG